MAHLTAADLASRTMKKGWARTADKEAPEQGRKSALYESAKEEMHRHADMINAANTQAENEKKKKRPPLYKTDDEED